MSTFTCVEFNCSEMLMLRYKSGILVLGCLLMLIFIQCSQPDHSGKTVFRYNESSGITSLDPAFARNQANIWATNQLFNGLIQLNDALEVRPCIAKKWEIMPLATGGTEYIFHLRSDVRFHDHQAFPGGKGRSVVAGDFVYSFTRILDPKIASPGAWVFNGVDTVDSQPAFLAPDDSTFIIRIKQVFPPFLSLLSMQYCSVVPREVCTFYGKDFRKNPVGTGPFRFKVWKEGIKLVLLKNPDYFEMENGERLPFLDAVAISFIVDKQSVFLEFVQGKLDFMSGLDASYKDELLEADGQLNQKYRDRINLSTQAYLNTEYLGFLMDSLSDIFKNSPLRLKKVRQAINYGFDRKMMMRYLRNNIGTPGIYGFYPPGLPSFDSVVYYDYQPEKTRQLLSEAGFPMGKGLPEITLASNASYMDLTVYIQKQLANHGIWIKIDQHPPASMREMIAQTKLPFFRGSWIADYPDAENYLSLFYSPNFTPKGPNYTHFYSTSYDELYRNAMKETNDTLRYRMYRKLNHMVMEESPVVVLYYDQVLRFSGKNISGLGNNPMNLLSLKRVRKH